MTADEFVAGLDRCRPSVEALVQRGWVSEVARETASGMTIRPRQNAHRSMEDPLLDLLERYDTGAFIIGVITLAPAKMTHIDRRTMAQLGLTLVGAEEGWPLTLCQRTGEIWLVDVSDYARRAYRYAVSGGQFLDALLLAAQYARPHVAQPPTFELTAENMAENQNAAAEWAARCASAAGLMANEQNPYRAVLGLVD